VEFALDDKDRAHLLSRLRISKGIHASYLKTRDDFMQSYTSWRSEALAPSSYMHQHQFHSGMQCMRYWAGTVGPMVYDVLHPVDVLFHLLAQNSCSFIAIHETGSADGFCALISIQMTSAVWYNFISWPTLSSYLSPQCLECYAVVTRKTRKPCCRKETARRRRCSFRFKVRRQHSLQV